MTPHCIGRQTDIRLATYSRQLPRRWRLWIHSSLDFFPASQGTARGSLYLVLAIRALLLCTRDKKGGKYEGGCLFYGPDRANFFFGRGFDFENISTSSIQK